ncbi:MAG: histidine kinase dimerization/phosphoacceptor domain -containing protein [Methanobacteriaceae archaeon]|nr:histidine kinase dimerization/phosphoacceptor domain -containing protein [Methanobacteriaceae archaeon]MDP2835789.1 histidine kinase dimerization/phosphoacceptor domain -containing protein [Methanobacteriaceae archaeon]MDP3035711.1 histidine kinase dimerization/phosphoacceptor domain -containing protein [Methanobacteriaceae archaeon]MDP3484414.1 histidine kinase dimerization/phosphoacceptor domain -containing protein [Methanobacteriaceae archaeon]MDP3623452.1 histidine kinase dimerization/ph
MVDKKTNEQLLFEIAGLKKRIFELEKLETDGEKIKKDLEKSRDFFINLFEEFPALIWRANTDGKCDYFNKNWLAFTGRTIEEEFGDGWTKGVHKDDFDRCLDIYLTSFKARKQFEMEYRLLHNTGEYRWILDLGMPFYDLDGDFAGYIGSCYDITKKKELLKQLEKSLEEKDLLLKEIHHRAKNNLMIISSLLNIQSTYIKDKESQEIFKESQNRARSMAIIHERLYQSVNLKKIDFSDYIRTLSSELFHAYVDDSARIRLEINLDAIFLDINLAIPLGLIINELITNSLKHGFPEGRSGKITINFHEKENLYELIVEDNGIGFPEKLDFQNTPSLGLQIVNSLADQIDGEIYLDRSQGTVFTITFKKSKYV